MTEGYVKTIAGASGETPADSEFIRFYKKWSQASGINPDPNDPRHFYNYQQAYEAGARPQPGQHWPSAYKAAGHPNRYVNGIDTITGQPMTSFQLLEALSNTLNQSLSRKMEGYFKR